MKTLFRISAALLLSLSLAQCATAATPIIDAQLTGSNNQLKSGATFTFKTGSTVVFESGVSIPGTQALDATLTAWAGATTGANKISYWSGTDAVTTIDFTAFSQTLLPLSTRNAWLGALMPSSPSNKNLVYFNSSTGFWEKLTLGNGLDITAGTITSTSGAPTTSKYILQTADTNLPNAQAIGDLGSGILKGTTITGVISIAEAGTDYLAPAAIGSTVQAYDADLDTWAAKTAPSGTVVGTSDAQTLTNKTLSAPTVSGAISFPTGTRQTFAPNGTNSGFNVGSTSSDPSSPSNGDLWYDSTNNTLDARINGATVNLGSGSGGGSGTVNSGTANQLAYYSSTGTAVSGLSTANNAAVVTNGSGAPVVSTTLPDLNAGTFTFSGGGSITGASGGVTLAASGTNQSITLTPTGTGKVVLSKSANTVDALLSIRNSNSGSTAQTKFDLFNDSGATSGSNGLSFFLTSAANSSPYSSVGGIWLYENSALAFATNGTERARISAAGNLLINTTTDDGTNKLQVNGSLGFPGGANLSGSSGAITVAANGSNQSINLTPSGTGGVKIVTNSVITNSVTEAQLTIKNSNSSGHASVVIDKGNDAYSGGFGFLSVGVSKWDAGLLDDTNFTIRDTVNNRKIFKLTLGAPANSLVVDGSGNVTAVGPYKTTDTTASTSTTTGALVVGGGAGIGGAVNVAGNVGLGIAASPSSGSYRTLQINGLNTGAQLRITDSTQAPSGLSIASVGGNGYIGNLENNSLYFATNNLTRVQIGSTGTITFATYGAGTLTTDSSGNITASSDERLKDIQGNYTAGLAELRDIQPINFKWKSGTGLDQTETYSGFSAQNVLAALPQAVDMGLDGKYTLQDRAIIAALVNAVNQLRAQNELLAGLVKDLANSPADKARAQSVLTLLQTVDTADKAARAAAKDAALRQRVAARNSSQVATLSLKN